MIVTDSKKEKKSLPKFPFAKLRKDKGYTQDDFAMLTGFSSRYISKLENGKANPRMTDFITITKALGLDIKLTHPHDLYWEEIIK